MIVVLCQNEVCVFKAFFSIIIPDRVLTVLYVVSGHMIYNQTNCYHSSIYKSVTACTENLLLRFSQFHKICTYDLLEITPRNNSSCSNPIRPIIELIQDIMVIYILAKFSADW